MSPAKRKKSAAEAAAPETGLSLGVIESAIEDVEASLRAVKASGARAAEKREALQFLADLKGRLAPYCRAVPGARKKDVPRFMLLSPPE
jgi:hypothetical protein